ncbi:hypothetical protein EDD21DRAFT_382726 [Dissophora ornata]|nr:hypothetical protein BGZ58_008473 [Dissophora ornata]KAI8598356.1 hypothetical protein EDD21DRAFT_382726 [Dissophora ornata]
MSSSVTHNIVRFFQLAVSISIVTTAAFLLHYRTQNHSNFANEPLASCISGAVAFIYAVWTILNHRRQPENHRWIYLHGFCCFVVGALLLACAIVAFIYSDKGYPCQSFIDGQDAASLLTGGELGQLGGFNDSHVIALGDYPPYNSGQQYGPDELCENTYEDMDKACAVMGVVGFFLWVCDFWLIFGWCGSGGQYDPHRNSSRQFRGGQVHPDDASDYYVADDTLDRSEREGHRNFVLDEDYYDTLDQRKREVGWLEPRTKYDPRGHVQDPISLLVQPNFFDSSLTEGAAATEPVDDIPEHLWSDMQRPPVQGQVTSPEGIHNARMTSYGVDHSSNDTVYHSTWPLEATAQMPSPHPHSQLKCRKSLDSSTLPKETMQEQSGQAQRSITPEHQRTDCSRPIPPTLIIRSATLPQEISQPLQDVASDQELDDVANFEENIPSNSSSPRYVDVSPGPTCYVFDSSHREYLPSYVNMAARIEQKQYRKLSLKSNTASGSATPVPSPSPHISEPASPLTTGSSRRIMVTGPGSDVVPQNEPSGQETSATKSPPSRTSTPSTPGRPRNITLPPVQNPVLSSSLPNVSGSYFPATATFGIPAIGYPTESSKSFASSDSVDQARQSPTGQAQQSVVQARTNKKLLKIKRKTSKLSIVTLKSGLQSMNASGNGTGTGSTGPSSLGTPKSEATGDSPLMSPRSPYVGDF